MKKIFTLCVVLCLSYLSMGATNLKHEFRATWLTTAWGNDWPDTTVTNDATRKLQQDELIAIFDRLQAGNMNAVCMQVRGRSDAFYKSSYEPWAAELAGARGKDPGYDPLAFAIEEAHKRGLELHAWVNPFRVTSTGTLDANDLVKKNAGQWIIKYNNGTFTGEIIDPGYPEAREYVLNVLMEIINNYDIDGIVMDDYFYPYGGTTTEDAASKALHKPVNVVDVNQDGDTDDDWRRSNVDVFLEELYDRIQTTKPWVRFGMGTFGIWTTQSKVAQAYGISLPSGISGLDDYDEQACNPVEWVKNGYVDYINPQLYWPTTSTRQNYNKLCQWWAKDVCEHFSNQLTNGKKVHFFSSQSISSNSAVSEIQAEIDANRSNLSSGYTGSVFFDTDAYLTMDNALMTSRFATHALTPPMDWKSNTALAAPTNLTVSGSTLTWQHATAERFTVYVYPKGTAWSTAKNDPAYLQGVIYGKSMDISGIDTNANDIAVCAYDRYGVEHTAAVYSNDSGAGTTPNPETIIWELNGGEVNTVTVEVPSLPTLEAQFKNDYNSYFGASVATTREITNFLYYGSTAEGGNNLVYNMMNDPAADWTWLRDYIISKSASNTTIQTALLAGTDAHWRYSIVAFLTASAGTNSTYTVDFSIAGQPSKWGTAYQIAHGAVLLPTYVTSAFPLPIPTHPQGHDFLGWYDNAEFIGSPLTTISADWTGSLYAKWHIIDPTWQITYTSTDGNKVTPYNTNVFGANIVSNTYDDGQGIIVFDGPVTSIGELAFCYCESLTSITIPNSVTSIGNSAFYGCGAITSITIPNSVTSIGEGAFYGCSSLISITIPNSVTSIGDDAFCWCSGLTSIIIPNSVTSIGVRAFGYCYSLDTIYVEATTPPALGSDVFEGTPSPVCIIPCGTLAAYQASDWAGQVSSFVEDCPPASAAITYVLNGGVQSEWETPQAMYNELNALWNTFSGTSKTWGDLSTLKADVAKGIPTLAYGMALDFIVDENFKEKFEWLVTYMDAKCTEQGQTLPSSDASFLRYNLQAFFIDGMRISWPISADYTICGVSTVEAYQPYWKSGFANPTNPTEEFVLNAPYREGYTFAGWYTTPDFSGKKVTTINSETTGTLYAKWVEYIPTIAEVRALADNTETKVAGVVNFISVTNMYIQDATGGILVSTNDTIDYRVGDKIVVRGTKTIYGGAPKIENAIVVSVDAAALYDVTTFETLKPLISDSIDHKYFATRVTIPGLKIVSYDAYDAYPIVQDLLGNQVVCHMMSINPVAFPIGTKITITAVAGWYNGFQFVGDAAGIELATNPKKDTYNYPVREEKYSLTNDWVYSNIEGNFAANKPGSDNYVRGMAAKDGIMYFINRENASLTRVDGATGEMLEPLKITGEHLFERIGENGEWGSACVLPFNDVKFDQAGNCLIAACVAGSSTFQIYEVDLATGAATLLYQERLYDNPDFTDNGYRFDAFGVYGDVKGNACVMAGDANSLDVYRWIITNGNWGSADRITADLSKDGYYWTATSWSTAPQVYPLDERGSYFYVDGFNTYPMLFNEYGTLLEDFSDIPTEFYAYNNEGESVRVNAQVNGLQEFQVGDEHFLLIAAGYTGNEVAPSSFVLYKFADDSRSFSALEPLWYFPANGMGGATIGFRTAPVSVEVEGNKAHLYLYACNNGYARYTLNVGDKTADVIDPTWQITYTSTDGNTVTPTKIDVFGANIVSNVYENGVGTITFDGPVTSIGARAFDNCSFLTSITIPNSVTSIGEYAFDNCSGLTSITIPNSVTSIGEYAFGGCSRLISMTIPSSVTHIGHIAFYYCSSLTSIVVEQGNTIYDSRNNCNAIIETATNTLVAGCQNTMIPNNVTSIGVGAFEGCEELHSINIPNNILKIETYAFFGCSKLISITIPNSVTFIGQNAFGNCDALVSITVDSTNSVYDSRDNCNAIIYTAANYLSAGCQNTIIPNSVTGIGAYAFGDCNSLTSIIIPNSVRLIDGCAFYSCKNMSSITIPNSVTNIAYGAFMNCSKLDTVYIEATIPPVLVKGVFTSSPLCVIPCGTLAAYEASDWVSQVGSFVEDCVEGQQIFYTSTDGNIVTPTQTDVFGANIVSNTYENGVGTITFDGPVTSIGSYAFYSCKKLTSITIPNSVTNIGYGGFYDCSSLTSITIPNSVTSIGNAVFYRCSSLTSITIPNSVTSIGKSAFACSSLISITIPNSVTSLGWNAFGYCDSITSIEVESGNTTYDSRENCNAIIETATNTLITGCQNTVIPNSVTSIGQIAFYGCYSLKSIALPNNITTIGDSAFFDCTSLMSVTIPSSVRLIGTNAFYNCTEIAKTNFLGDIEDWCNIEFERYSSNPITYSHNLYINDQEINDVVIPNTVDSIRRYTFYRCASLTSVTLPYGLTTIGERAFTSCTSLESLTIPESVTFIADAAFALCESLQTMYIHAITPPILEGEILFTGSPISTCYIPCGTLAAYEASEWASQVSEFVEEGCTPLQQCGDDLYWEYADGVLTITGTGDMYDYADDKTGPAPWYDVRGSITTINMPNEMTKIGDYTFYRCTALTSISLPEQLKHIGNRAFAQDTKIAGEVVIPEGVTDIADRAFYNCNKVNRFTLLPLTSPTLGEKVFESTSASFYISCEAMDDYKVATNWSKLKSRFVDACLNIYHYNTALGANGVHTTEDTLVANIYYRRHFTPNRWETLYLPFEVDRVTVLEDGFEYELTAWSIFSGGHYYLAKPYGIENKEVVFGFTQVVDAHTPYIIQFKDEYYRDKIITFYSEESWNKLSTSFEMLSSSYEMQMAGNTTMQDQILEEPVYMLRGTSNFILQNTTTVLHPFECYVMPYATPSGTPARMNVRFRGDVPTAVESVKGNESHLTYTVDGYTLTVYPQGQAFSIYSLNGALIYSCEAGKEAVDCELNSGCYLLHAGTEAHKIML